MKYLITDDELLILENTDYEVREEAAIMLRDGGKTCKMKNIC